MKSAIKKEVYRGNSRLPCENKNDDQHMNKTIQSVFTCKVTPVTDRKPKSTNQKVMHTSLKPPAVPERKSSLPRKSQPDIEKLKDCSVKQEDPLGDFEIETSPNPPVSYSEQSIAGQNSQCIYNIRWSLNGNEIKDYVNMNTSDPWIPQQKAPVPCSLGVFSSPQSTRIL